MHGNILLIELNYTIRRMVARELKTRGLTVLQADTLDAASNLLNKHEIDAVVCEIYLPDGAIFHLLADPRLADKPALGLGYNLDEQDAWGQFGRTNFLKKPVPTRVIVEHVLALLQDTPVA